jgi:hypothetical protein
MYDSCGRWLADASGKRLAENGINAQVNLLCHIKRPASLDVVSISHRLVMVAFYPDRSQSYMINPKPLVIILC